MDHRRKPTGTGPPPIEVPLLEFLPYDLNGFEGFPDRQGFTVEGKLDYSRPTSELASLVQSWLYFSLLSELVGFTVTPNALTEPGGNVLSSALLTLLLDNWQRQLRSLGVKRCENRLKQVRQTIEIAVKESLQCDQYDPPDSDESFAIVTLSVKLLIVTLMHIYNALYPEEPFPYQDRRLFPIASPKAVPSPAAQLLVRRMQQAKWCPQAIRRICSSYDFSCAHYLSQLPRFRQVDHSSCSESRCLAYNIDSTVYKSKHTTYGCKCRHMFIDIAKVNVIIESGDIPLVQLTPTEDGTVDMSVTKSSNRRAYNVISHVWIDGLGNPNANSLPNCQLLRLYNMLRGVQRRGTGGRFWIDTLCIPVGETFKPIRRMAIDSMASIYQDAVGVFVVDAEIKETVESHSENEFLGYILCSAWNSRCWTYQEAVLGKRFYFDTRDGMKEPPIHDVKLFTGLSNGYSGVRWLQWRILRSPLSFLVQALHLMFEFLPPSHAVSVCFRICCGPQAWHKCSEALKTRDQVTSAWSRITNFAVGSIWLLGAITFPILTLPQALIFTVIVYSACFVGFIAVCCIWSGEGSKVIPMDELLEQQKRLALASGLLAELQPRRVSAGMDVWNPDVAARLRTRRLVHAWNALVDRTATKFGDLHIILASLTNMVPFRISALASPAARMRAIVGSHETIPIAMLFDRSLTASDSRDPDNPWLPLAPTSDLLPIDPEAPSMYIGKGEVAIRLREIEASFVVFECSRDKSHAVAPEYFDPLSGTVLTFEPEEQSQRHDTTNNNQTQECCYLMETPRSGSVHEKLCSIQAARLIITRRDADILHCSYDNLTDVTVRHVGAIPPEDNLVRKSSASIIKLPFSKSGLMHM